MDAYQGIESKNQWRNSMNKLESLYMLMGCGTSSSHLEPEQQQRMALLLQDAYSHGATIVRLESSHAEIRRQINAYQHPQRYQAMLETIYHRFGCLNKTDPVLPLHQRYSQNFCPGGVESWMLIKARHGGRVRAYPHGPHIASWKYGTRVRILEQQGNWYKVLLTRKDSGMQSNIAYLHHTILSAE